VLVTGVPFCGDVMTTVGATPRVTVTLALPDLSTESAHVIVIVLAPIASGSLTVVAEPADRVTLIPVAAFVTVQVVPPGIVDSPPVTKFTATGEAVVKELFAGEKIVGVGPGPPVPRLITISAFATPAKVVQLTLIVFAPYSNATLFVAGVAEGLDTPLDKLATTQVVPDGMVEVPFTV
jgi:hypothetical protein